MSNAPHDEPSPRSLEEGPTVISKRCPKCGETKPRDAFSRHKGRKNGLQSYCKSCHAPHKAAYRAANLDKLHAYAAAYHAAHRDEILAYRAAYKCANRDKRRAQDHAHYIAHHDQYLARHTAYRTAHRDKVRTRSAICRRNNPDVSRAAYHRRVARIKGNGGAGVSAAELRALRVAQAGICAYCRLQYNKLTIDHVIPIDHGGPHKITNIALACRDCNSSKGARTPEQWTKRWYYDLDISRLM